MSKRMFENAGEGKFWEVWLDGANVFTRHGKTGANGQTKLKAGDQATLDKMVKDKLEEGYVQTGGDVPKGPELDKKELKRHLSNLKPLADDPAYLVLADWLQTQDHPWGELIALQHGAATNPKKAASLQKQADKHLEENAPVILGEAADDTNSHFEWHHGFVRRAVIASGADLKAITKAVKSFLEAPVAHMLETLVIAPYPLRFTTYRDWSTSRSNLAKPWTDLEKIAKLVPARITRIGLGGWPASMAHGYVEMPAFSKVSAAFPKVTALELTGYVGDKPGKLSLPLVTDLAVRFSQGTDEAMKALSTAKLPKLERLTVWLGGEGSALVDDVHSPYEYDEEDEDGDRYPSTFSAGDLEGMESHNVDCEVSADGLTTLLDARFGPKLTHLTLGSPRWTEPLMAALAKGKLLASLTSLTIHGGSLTDEIVKPLIAAKKALSHLASLELRGQISPAAAKKLKALANATVVSTDEPEDFHFRFTATME